MCVAYKHNRSVNDETAQEQQGGFYRVVRNYEFRALNQNAGFDPWHRGLRSAAGLDHARLSCC